MKEGWTMKKQKRRSFVFFLVVMIIIGRLYIDNNIIQTTNVEIISNKIPNSFEGYRIVQLSDLHNRSFGRDNSRLIRAMRELEPDIVVLTGDMVTGNDKDFTVFFNLVEQISQEYPIYYIPGNHEVALKDSSKQEFLNLFERTGVVFLNNQKVELESDCGDIINLYGLWYQNLHYVKEPLNIEMIEQYIGVANTSVYNILLTHQPKYFELYEKWGADLIMSGHIHGGMVRLPYFGPVFSPDEGLFPQYAAGEYHLNDSVLVVSRGLGIGTRGFRVFNRPDLVLITLKSA